MADILAAVTEDYRQFLTQLACGLIVWDPTPTHFKVGEGGWRDRGAGPEQRTPVNNLKLLSAPFIPELDCVVDPTRSLVDQRYPTNSRGTFEKALVGGNITNPSTFVMRVECFLDFGEFNADGFGNNPEIWELGIFCDHPTLMGQKLMIAYATLITGFIKTGLVQFDRFVKVSF